MWRCDMIKQRRSLFISLYSILRGVLQPVVLGFFLGWDDDFAYRLDICRGILRLYFSGVEEKVSFSFLFERKSGL